MKISPQKKWLLIIAFLLLSGGFVYGIWEVSLLGIIVAAVGGSPTGAVLMALLLDLAYGAPLGLVRYAFFPFTLLAVGASVVRFVALHYMLQFRAQERL